MRTSRLWLALWLAAVGSRCAVRGEPSAAAIVRAPQPAVDSVAPASPGQPPASSLESRAQDYWARRQAKDLPGAYPYYCSAYRARVSQAQFLHMTRLVRFDLRDVHVTNATSRGDRADVTIGYRFFMPTMVDQPLEGQTKETWARDTDGQWCKEDEPLVLPFPPP